MTFKLRPYVPEDYPTLSKFSVTSDQTAFVDPLIDTLTKGTKNRSYVIEVKDKAVGFFQVDDCSDKQSIENHVELHEVIIDQKHQGKGYGKLFITALSAFLNTEFPEWDGMCLTVNCKNTPAKRLYELGGFVETGNLKLDGPSGPQFIMQKQF